MRRPTLFIAAWSSGSRHLYVVQPGGPGCCGPVARWWAWRPEPRSSSSSSSPSPPSCLRVDACVRAPRWLGAVSLSYTSRSFPLLTSPWDLSPSGLAPKNRRRLGGISLGPLLLFKQLPICKTGARGARLRAKYEDARCIATASSISSQPVFCAVERPPPIARQHEHGAVRGVL